MESRELMESREPMEPRDLMNEVLNHSLIDERQYMG